MTKIRGLDKPKFYRSLRNSKGKERRLRWEIYSYNHFFINIELANLEILINKWPKEDF